ncbi:MAG: hypothetical protein ABTQ26_08395, partial [Azonexus sp.]
MIKVNHWFEVIQFFIVVLKGKALCGTPPVALLGSADPSPLISAQGKVVRDHRPKVGGVGGVFESRPLI